MTLMYCVCWWDVGDCICMVVNVKWFNLTLFIPLGSSSSTLSVRAGDTTHIMMSAMPMYAWWPTENISKHLMMMMTPMTFLTQQPSQCYQCNNTQFWQFWFRDLSKVTRPQHPDFALGQRVSIHSSMVSCCSDMSQLLEIGAIKWKAHCLQMFHDLASCLNIVVLSLISQAVIWVNMRQ